MFKKVYNQALFTDLTTDIRNEHLDAEISKEEVEEVFSIATLIGGTIVIPHLRRAHEFWEELENHNV